MSEPAIRVEGLSKRYKIGAAPRSMKTLRETINDAFTASFRRIFRGNGNSQVAPRQEAMIWALKDVGFEVAAGEVWGIIGRNGAGKSTLLKILSRVTEPTEGTVIINGRLGSLLEVGTGFHSELTGRENIFLNGAILGMKRTEIIRKFDTIVAFAEIEKFIDTPVKYYSSGMYVRLAFAVASHLDPEILLVDEVLAVGDSQFQKKCLGKMQGDATQGKTALIVSHNIHVILNLCTKAVLLEKGQVRAVGPCSTIVEQYVESGATTPATISWNEAEAPGTEKMRLLKVAVLDAEEHNSTVVEIDKEVGVEFVYDVLVDLERAYVALWLKDRIGTEVLSSANAPFVTSTPDAFTGKPMRKGRYRTICKFPADFLNAGHYAITPILGINVRDTQVLLPDALEFEVADTSDMRKEYQDHWLGVVRPKLPWSTQYVGDQFQVLPSRAVEAGAAKS